MCSPVSPGGSCTKCLAAVTLQSPCKRRWLHTSEGRTSPPSVWRLRRPCRLFLVPPHFLALLSHQLERFATAALRAALPFNWTRLKRREGSRCREGTVSILWPPAFCSNENKSALCPCENTFLTLTYMEGGKDPRKKIWKEFPPPSLSPFSFSVWKHTLQLAVSESAWFPRSGWMCR